MRSMTSVSHLPLIERKIIAENTLEISLAREAGFHFEGGQYIRLGFPNGDQTLNADNSRKFSLCSSPFEKDKLTLAFRVSPSPIKQQLLNLPLGTKITVDGPYGNFTLPQKQHDPAIFIAGGIGIAPFMSIIKEKWHEKSKQSITLLYSNSSLEATAYLTELDEMASYKNFSLHCRIGRIDWDYISSTTHATPAHTWYIAGSPRMITDIIQFLQAHDIKPSRIVTEAFTGLAENKSSCGKNCQCQCGSDTQPSYL